MKRSIRTRCSGFTLIELLVVISIIALLVGIMLPALGQARQSARLIQCKSLQRQVGIALNAYSADNDGFFPFNYQSMAEWSHAPDALNKGLVLNDYLPAHAPDSQYSVALHCPDDPNDYPNLPTGAIPSLSYLYRQTAYGGGGIWHRPIQSGENARVGEPRWLLAEQHNIQAFTPPPLTFSVLGNVDVVSGTPYGYLETLTIQSNWHENGGNVLYEDGHVSWKNFGDAFGEG